MSIDLFGEAPKQFTRVEIKRSRESEPRGYAAQPGTGPAGETCSSCRHYVLKQLAKTYRKCELRRANWTGGAGTDVKARAPACSKWEKPVPPVVESHRPDSMFGATFSDCQVYRYRLWRHFIAGGGKTSWRDVAFLMLNPSTADAIDNDPTVERCERRAREMGFEGVQVVNLFALRSTDPKALYDHVDPVGPENDQAILDCCTSAALVICAWGTHGALHARGAKVLGMLRLAGVKPHFLRLNADGSPAHPLYLPYSLQPQPWGPL